MEKKKKSKMKKTEGIIETLMTAIIGAIFVMISLWLLTMFVKADDMETKLFLLPFAVCSIAISGYELANIFKNYKAEMLLRKAYAAIFLIFITGFIAYVTVMVIKQENSLLSGLWMSPLWIACILAFYKYFIKKD